MGGMCSRDGMCGMERMHGRGYAWWDVHGLGACVVGGMSMAGACMAGGCVWWGGSMCGGGGFVHGGGHAWQGACMVWGCVVGGGVHVWQERRSLQRAVRSLLECIQYCPFYIIQYFVNNYSTGQPAWGTWPSSSTFNQQGSTSNQYSTNSPSPYVSPNDGQSDATNRAGGYGAGYPIYGGGYATKYQRILIRIFFGISSAHRLLCD